ncbi:MAG: PEP-CTERM sorting domain-containing protein [Planctomycetota bacterium]
MASQTLAARILFVRGADRSGGATEGAVIADPFDIRGYTEQLADIRDPAGPVFSNDPAGNGNHSWFELATLLTANGYHVEQTTESIEPGAPSTGPTEGAPVAFGAGFEASTFADLNANNGVTQSRTLQDYEVVVFGSNNAVYASSQIDAVDDFIRSGGGAVFISDANFGSVRGDAQRSDQQFLDRFGILVNEDRGTYRLDRGAGNTPFTEFRSPASPLLESVNSFDGEGVSPFTLPNDLNTLPVDVSVEIVAGVPEGQTVRGPGNNARSATPQDASLLAVRAGAGRIVGHFDRNTFFNRGGAGSNLNRFDNEQLALNIFDYVSEIPEPSTLLLLAIGTSACLSKRRK